MPDHSAPELFALYTQLCSDAEAALGESCEPGISEERFGEMLEAMTVEQRAEYEEVLRDGFLLSPEEREKCAQTLDAIRDGQPPVEIKSAVDDYFRRQELEARRKRPRL